MGIIAVVGRLLRRLANCWDDLNGRGFSGGTGLTDRNVSICEYTEFHFHATYLLPCSVEASLLNFVGLTERIVDELAVSALHGGG